MTHRRHGIGRWFGRHEGLLLLVMGLAWLGFSPRAAEAQSDSLTLSWTAPADQPGSIAVERYDVRVYGVPITPTNWTYAAVVPSRTPRAPGSAESLVVRGLDPGRSYWFAIRSVDRAGNWSAMSNVVVWNAPPESSPPAAPTGLHGTYDPELGGVVLEWNPNSEADLAAYDVYRAVDPLGEWTKLTTQGYGASGFLDQTIPAGGGRFYYAVTASDWSRNESARSVGVVVVIHGALSSYPVAWRLGAPYPNPARDGQLSHVPIEVPVHEAEARVDIVNAANQVVRRLTLLPRTIGYTQIDWDGRNEQGVPCAPGVYRALLFAGDVRQTVRVARIP